MKVLITGASSGIGREMIKLLANKYDEFVLVGRNKERLEETKIILLGINNTLKIETVPTDVSIKQNCINLYNNNKNVDLLINDAGFGDYGYFNETDLDKDLLMIKPYIS